MTNVVTAPVRKIRILIAEDSRTQREMLLYLLETAGDFEIAGVAADGIEAVEKTERLRPDIVLMDCQMPRADGFEATRTIMNRCPTPIVMCSNTLSQDEVYHTFDAIKSGALAFVVKPSLDPGSEEPGNDLIRTLRLMCEVKVVGRRAQPLHVRKPERPETAAKERRVSLICLAGSTGAPGVIADILTGLGGKPAAPILVVQHMAAGFVAGFAKWLSNTAGFPVQVGIAGTAVKAGEVYLAPDDCHMGINERGQIMLDDGPLEEGFRPSADFLFRSAALHRGAAVIGVLLTGMGRDGAAGLAELKRIGALTVAQDEASCVVFGMPREAILRGAATYVLSPAGIAQLIGGVRRPVGG
jgi:two-component system chemotaxis response regulator CheB